MFSLLAAGDSDGAAAVIGGMSVILSLIAVVICVVWIVFPFIVNSHFRAMRKLQHETNQYLKRMAEEVVQANANRRSPDPKAPKPTVPPSKSDVYRV
jgi:uncharacterized membrane protein